MSLAQVLKTLPGAAIIRLPSSEFAHASVTNRMRHNAMMKDHTNVRAALQAGLVGSGKLAGIFCEVSGAMSVS